MALIEPRFICGGAQLTICVNEHSRIICVLFQHKRRTGVKKKPPPKSETHAGRIRRERGAQRSEPSGEDFLTPTDLLNVLREDVLAVSKAAELRIRELTIIVTEYAKGNIDPQEANERFDQYVDRWRDAIDGGVRSVEGLSDDEILNKIAASRRGPPHR
jgi:hypothetical protein